MILYTNRVRTPKGCQQDGTSFKGKACETEDLSLVPRIHIQEKEGEKKEKQKAGHGGACLQPQCWGGGNRRILRLDG